MFYFLVYAVAGWCCEVVFAASTKGKFVNRGFLNGPYCPVYGFGVVLVVWLLRPFADNFIILFLLSVVVTSALEFFTGFVLEKIFHTKWWDYTGTPFNIKGYICLKFSLLWGFACVFVVRIVHPSVEKLIDLIPVTYGWIILSVLYAGFAVDLVITVISLSGLAKELRGIEHVKKRLRSLSDKMGTVLSDGAITAREMLPDLNETMDNQYSEKFIIKQQQMKEDLNDIISQYSGLKDIRSKAKNRILKAFPDMKKTYTDSRSAITAKLEQIREKITGNGGKDK